jgi:hypothetical protein
MQAVSGVQRNRDHVLRADQVRHQSEVAVRRDEREDALRLGGMELALGTRQKYPFMRVRSRVFFNTHLPPLKPDAWMEAGVVEHSWIHEGHGQI